MDRLDELLDAEARPEVERLRRPAFDRIQVARDLDRLQVVKPELVTRRDAEAAIGRVLGTGLDPPDAAASGGSAAL